MGNILKVVVHAANTHDTVGGCYIIELVKLIFRTIIGVCGDAGYRGTFFEFAKSIGLKVEIVERIGSKWTILPKRWIVERTIGWLNHSRRLSKDYEISVDSAENMVYISHVATLLKRLF